MQGARADGPNPGGSGTRRREPRDARREDPAHRGRKARPDRHRAPAHGAPSGDPVQEPPGTDGGVVGQEAPVPGLRPADDTGDQGGGDPAAHVEPDRCVGCRDCASALARALLKGGKLTKFAPSSRKYPPILATPIQHHTAKCLEPPASFFFDENQPATDRGGGMYTYVIFR